MFKRGIYDPRSSFCNLKNCKLTRKNFETSKLFESCSEFCLATAAILVAMLGNSYSLSPLFKKSEKRDELKQFSHPRATCLQFLLARQLMQVNLVDNVTVDAVL